MDGEAATGRLEGGMGLRRCTPQDQHALLTWITSAHDLLLFTGPMLTWPLTLEQLDALSAIPGRHDHTLVSDREPGPLGRVEVTVVGNVGRLSRVILAPRHRGRGLARVLVSLAIEDARERGARCVGLSVIEANRPALRTYSGLGFVPNPSVAVSRGTIALTLPLAQPST